MPQHRPRRPLVHRLLYLPLMGLSKDGAHDLVHPDPHLPAYPLLHLGDPVPPQAQVV